MPNTDTDQTKIALIENNIGFIHKDIGEIKLAIKDLAGVYITKLQFDDQNKQLEIRMLALEKSGNLWKWMSPVLSSVLTAILTFLLIFYLQNIK